MYLLSFFTRLIHFLPGEISHFIALKGLKFVHFLGLLEFFMKNSLDKYEKVKVNNDSEHKFFSILNFNNRLGIAAGLDKDGEYIDCLSALGVGFIEVGTGTPKRHYGNANLGYLEIKKINHC